MSKLDTEEPVRTRLLKAALDCFLADDYHQVTTRMIADRAGANASMIRYYFGNKEGLYEEMIRETMNPILRLTHGDDLYAYLERHADEDALFSAAMDSVEALAGDSFASDFDWGRCERLIDVGGSRGAKALAILKRDPGLRALVLDRPQVVAEAERHWRQQPAAGAERLRFQACDILEAVPAAQGDREIYLLSAVLHGFDDEACARILGNLATAVAGTGARVALLEAVLPETGSGLAAASFDLQMFMATSGRERTLREWQALFARGGLELEEMVGLRSFGNILVLRGRTQ